MAVVTDTTRGRETSSAWGKWGPILALPAAVLLFTPGEWPAWALMWLLAISIFAGCKWLTWRNDDTPEAPWWQHLGYLLAWPGLDARAFLRRRDLPDLGRVRSGEWLFALVKLALGAMAFWGLSRLVPPGWELLRGWIGMVGLAFLLHFGSFHLLSCAWRSIGVDAEPLMHWPALANGLSDFWSHRWNTAFRDFTFRFLFRPLTSKVGPRWGTLAGFLFSGLVHDLVISVPARGGYGLPTLYFLLQGLAILVERSPWGKAIGLSRGWRGRLFAAAVLILPAGILFHPPFVRGIVVPFMAALGAAGYAT